jgi:integrase/recombinase XerD
VTDLTPEVVGRFVRARAEAGYRTKWTERRLRPLLNYLKEIGQSPPAPQATPVEMVVARFHRHLVEERGLSDSTVAQRVPVARQFLATRLAPLDLDSLTATEVSTFILRQSERLTTQGMKNVVTGLRAFLKFLYLAGLTDRELAFAVPTVAPRYQQLPRALPEAHLELLLQSCDRENPVGIRDFAILTVLARLGLRAGELARLELDDIDWTVSEIRIRGKGPRLDKLPLPADVGEALVDYLQRGRPTCSGRSLFIRACAPLQALSPGAMGQVVRHACVRAGLPAHGPHRLRHTVATGLIRRGSPLAEIAQLLRHQSLRTTVIYAKVDREALSSLAQAWPGEAE